MAYPRHRAEESVPASPRFPAIEEQILAYWEQDGTFAQSIAQRPAGENGSNEFVFYDGPPFANGLPHYGHLLTGYAKDVIPRYQTLRGKRVERRFGWDTHGLPAELEAERELGIQGKADIERVGIDRFNEACRSSVLKYTREWQDYVTRQARWVDFDNDYKTLDVTYMESVLWAFKQLYDKGLAYEGYRVLPYCWNDQTPLSNHELRMDDDVYQNRQDNTATVGVRLDSGELALIWTTTPWTLPSNLAIAVGPEIDYVTVAPADGPLAGERVILAKALVGSYARELGRRRRSSPNSRARTWPAGATRRSSTTLPIVVRTRRPARRPSTSSRRTSSPPRTAQGLSTWPPPSVRTTWPCAERPVSAPCCRWTTGPCSPLRFPTTRACRCSTPTSRSSPTCATAPGRWHGVPRPTAPCWCARPRTSTRTRTAGDAASRSSTRP